MYGLSNIQTSLEGQANKNLAASANAETARKSATKQLKMADDAARKQSMATGAGIGISGGIAAGLSATGIAATGGAGLLAGYLIYKYL